jgi:hypothetical protein
MEGSKMGVEASNRQVLGSNSHFECSIFRMEGSKTGFEASNRQVRVRNPLRVFDLPDGRLEMGIQGSESAGRSFEIQFEGSTLPYGSFEMGFEGSNWQVRASKSN